MIESTSICEINERTAFQKLKMSRMIIMREKGPKGLCSRSCRGEKYKEDTGKRHTKDIQISMSHTFLREIFKKI